MLNSIILRNNLYYTPNVKSIRIYVYIFPSPIEILLKINSSNRWNVSVISESRYISIDDSFITANENLSVNRIIIRICNYIKKKI
jgi:hypothetical protein